MPEESSQSVFNSRVRHFAEILNPLFDSTFFRTQDQLFEFVCVLVRPAGIQDSGWDSLYESQATLGDLRKLASIDLPAEKFPDAQRTRMRLALLSYCHVTEMDFPYALLANLLRLRLGARYDMDPFRDLVVPIKRKKKGGLLPKLKLPSPGRKIVRIQQLAQEANLPEIGPMFEVFYDNDIRNAVYHSDYTLTSNEFRILAGHRFSRKKQYLSQVIEWEELNELLTDTFAFYTALFALYERCRKSFGDFKDAFIPYDFHYKGLLQLVFDEAEMLVGFRIYWPNESRSECSRTQDGCSGYNFLFDPDGSVNFMVGCCASNPGIFSPLVERDKEPVYTEILGTNVRPYWPERLAAYKLSSL